VSVFFRRKLTLSIENQPDPNEPFYCLCKQVHKRQRIGQSWSGCWHGLEKFFVAFFFDNVTGGRAEKEINRLAYFLQGRLFLVVH